MTDSPTYAGVPFELTDASPHPDWHLDDLAQERDTLIMRLRWIERQLLSAGRIRRGALRSNEK